jgi:murein DD-endopeptidase MepM/ murein hydrolase activator NlpD
MFYTENDFSTNPGHALPSEGDYVEVFLAKGAHSFNLQKGIFKGTIINKNDVKQTLANLNISFAKFGGSAKSAYKKDPIKTGPTPLAILGKTAFPLQKGAPWNNLVGALGVGKVNSNWGPPGSVRALKKRRHCGTDFRANVGQPVYAVADGTVVHADWNAGLGREITIKHKENTYAADPSKNVYSRYAHLKGFSVKNGSSVKAGQLIGHSGDSFSGKEGIPAKKGGMDAHLHLELWVGGYAGDCGIPDDYPDGPTNKFTIDFMAWLAEQQAAANMPGAMVSHTLQEGTESAPAASIGVESDAQAGDLESADPFGEAIEEYEDEEAFREFADDLDTGGPGAYVVDDSELMASLDEIEEDVDYMPEGTLGSDYGSWGLDAEDYDGSSDGWATDD